MKQYTASYINVLNEEAIKFPKEGFDIVSEIEQFCEENEIKTENVKIVEWDLYDIEPIRLFTLKKK